MADFSVVKVLFDKFSTTTRPGSKCKCPFCGAGKFSIKSDDSVGKCFSACGRAISAGNYNNSFGQPLTEVLHSIFDDWHDEFISLADKLGKNAYRYVVENRKIHPQVARDAMLGVVPVNYKLGEKFDPEIEKIQKEIETLSNQKNSRTRRKLENLNLSLETLIEAQAKLQSIIRPEPGFARAGYLAFFYVDSRHQILSIKLRDPYTRDFLWFKPLKNCGVFGHDLFSPYEGALHKPVNNQMLALEGDFNVLQLQSTVLRAAEAQDRPGAYVHACAVGGVNGIDFQTLKRACRKPVICYDNDLNGAGLKFIDVAQEHMSFWAITTPTKDMDEFLLSFGDDQISALNALRDLIKKRELYTRKFEAVAQEIKEVRQKQWPTDTRKLFEIHEEVSKVFIADLIDRAKFLHDKSRAYLFLERDYKLIELDPENRDYILLIDNYGIIFSEDIFKYLYFSLHAHVLKNGKLTKVNRHSHFDQDRFKLYISNFKSQIYVVTKDSWELVNNGADGILFVNDPNAEPFEVSTIEKESNLFEQIILSKINFVGGSSLTSAERRTLVQLWFLSIYFPNLMPTRPILAFIGAKGSGKSIAGRKMGQLIYGPKFNVTPLPHSVTDFDAVISNSFFLVIDNADAKCDYLADRLAIAATGGSIKKRKYYTTNDSIEVPVSCFIVITSRTPEFRRDDVADRLLINKVERFETFTAEGRLLKEVLDHRNELLSEVFKLLQTALASLEQSKDRNDSGNFRMADFADFAVKVMRHSGQEDFILNIFKKMSSEQSSFTLENESICDLLFEWVDRGNAGREVTNKELCEELGKIARKTNQQFPYQTAGHQAFAQKMSHLRHNLSEFFDISERTAGQRKALFSFKRKDSKRTT